MNIIAKFKIVLICIISSIICLGSAATVVGASSNNKTEIRLDDKHSTTDSVHKVELLNERSRYTKTFLNNDGTTTVTSSTYSLNYFDGQAWQAIDTTIREDSREPDFTHSMLSNNFKVRLNNKGHKQAVTFSVSDDSVTYRAKNMNSVVGVVYGNTITFENAWQSTDLQYEVQNDELKMYIKLADADAPKSYSFEIATKNVDYKVNPDGSIDFINEKGDVSFQIPRLWLMDSSDNGKQYDKLNLNVKQIGNKTTLEITLDDRGLQYPIIIDPTTSLAVEGGDNHSLELSDNGTVWAWGKNNYGQLGDGTTIDRTTPEQVSGLTNVIAVAAGGNHSIAVKQDGTVWTWGYNYYGQLGNGTTANLTTPVQVSSLTNVIAVAAGESHSIAVKQDGTVWAWGKNNYGQLGNGMTTNSLTPVQVSGLTNVIAVATGESHSIAVKQDGTVWAWGYNYNGQLGNGTTTNSITPVQVSGLTNVIAVATGEIHSIAIKQDGTVWAWGNNYYGKLGNGTSAASITTPVQVSGLTNVIAVAAGESHSIAVKQDGTVWTWGYNNYGQLGSGTTTFSTTPVQVSELTNVIAVAAGGNHSIAVKQDGTVWTWGYNRYGQLGNGTTTISTTPVQSDLINVIAVAAGATHSIAVKQDGTVWAWGNNNYGQLGNRTNSSSFFTIPLQVSGLTNVIEVVAGGDHSLAIKQDGTVWAWGYNNYGQLGDGTISIGGFAIPVQVSGLTNVIAVAAGGYHSIAIKQDGTVWAWGNNNYGQLGNGTYGSIEHRTTPVQVSGLTNVIAVAAGKYHSIAIKQDGTVWTWGYNNYGQLGGGTTTIRTTPVQVSGLTNVIAVAAKENQSIAVKQDGTVWAWGKNNYGQLGDGTTINRTTPVQVSGLTNVIAVAAGESHSIAVKQDGTVWAWGYNNTGQLGNGTVTNYTTPVQVSGLSNVINVVAGRFHSIAIKQDGTVWAWGNNIQGQLGNRTSYAIRQVTIGLNAPTDLIITSQTNSSVTLNWTPPEGGSVMSYDIYKGTVLTGTVNGTTTTYTAMGLAENIFYSFTVKAKDAAGNVSSTSNVVSFIIDTQAPTAPGNLTVNGKTSNSLTLKWTAATDNVGVTEYEIHDGTTMIGTVNGAITTYTVSGLLANKVYRFTVKAKDDSGNMSVVSNIVMYGNIKLHYIYDSSGRLQYITDAATSEVLQEYEHDNNGNLLHGDN